MRLAIALVVIVGVGAAPTTGVAATGLKLPYVDPSRPWVAPCAFASVSFRDAREVWLSDACGHLYRSADGGATWIALSPEEAPLRFWDGHESSALTIVWHDGQIGTIRGPRGDLLAQTDDGGSTWSRRSAPGDPGRMGVPRTDRALAAARALILTQGTLQRAYTRWEQLAGVVSRGLILGWTERHIYRWMQSERRWQLASDAPAPLERVVLVDDMRVLARSRAGALFRSYDGTDWRRSDDPFDSYDWSRLTGASPTAANPMACLLGDGPATLLVRTSQQGCFGGKRWTLQITRDRGRTRVEGDAPDLGSMPSADATVSLAAGQALLRAFVDAAGSAERGDECGSTSHRSVELQWRCGDGPPAKASFHADYCDDGDPPRRADLLHDAATTTVRLAQPDRGARYFILAASFLASGFVHTLVDALTATK